MVTNHVPNGYGLQEQRMARQGSRSIAWGGRSSVKSHLGSKLE